MFCPWTEADKVWQSLVQGLLGRKFSSDLGVLFIQIVGRSDPETNPHLLSMYVERLFWVFYLLEKFLIFIN